MQTSFTYTFHWLHGVFCICSKPIIPHALIYQLCLSVCVCFCTKSKMLFCCFSSFLCVYCICVHTRCDYLLTHSCSSFIHTGVILSRKSGIRLLNIVRAGAMNYLPVRVFSVTFYLFILSFLISSLKALITYPNCNMTLKEYNFTWWWTCFREIHCVSGRDERPQMQNYRHHNTCGRRIRGSLSADSQPKPLSLWQHFKEKGSTITTSLCVGVGGDRCQPQNRRFAVTYVQYRW